MIKFLIAVFGQHYLVLHAWSSSNRKLRPDRRKKKIWGIVYAVVAVAVAAAVDVYRACYWVSDSNSLQNFSFVWSLKRLACYCFFNPQNKFTTMLLGIA